MQARDNKVKVIHLIDSGGFYGAEVMLLHLCQAQLTLGIEVDVISIGTPGIYEKPLEKKLHEYKIACKPWRMMALPDLRESIKIIQYAALTNTDIIHCHGYKGNILLGLLPKSARKIPVITTVHGYTRQKKFGKMAINQWLDRRCLNRLDATVLVSEGMRHQIPKGLKNLHVVPNGIPEKIPAGAEQAIAEFLPGDFCIGTIGRLSHEKNFQLLIRSMPKVLAQIPNAKLVIFGEGGERQMFEQLVQDLNLQQQVLLPGYIDEPARLYRHADVFINCSLTEGMPMTLLEAMREGCFIVATDIPANRKLLENTRKGATLVGFAEDELATAIANFEMLAETDAKKGQVQLQQAFSENYTAAAMARNYLAIYESV